MDETTDKVQLGAGDSGCGEHPGSPVEVIGGVAWCASCRAENRTCGAQFGSKFCAMAPGHGGDFHVSPSGSAWPVERAPEPAPAPVPPDPVPAAGVGVGGASWDVGSGDCVTGRAAVRGGGVRALVEFCVVRPSSWVTWRGSLLRAAGDPVYGCTTWTGRVRHLAGAAVAPIEAAVRASGAPRLGRKWFKSMSIWACEDGSSFVRLDAQPGSPYAVVVVPADVARARRCDRCRSCLASRPKEA